CHGASRYGDGRAQRFPMIRDQWRGGVNRGACLVRVARALLSNSGGSQPSGRSNLMDVLLVVILLLLLFGGGGGIWWGFGAGWGIGPIGLIILVVIVAVLLSGYRGRRGPPL